MESVLTCMNHLRYQTLHREEEDRNCEPMINIGTYEVDWLDDDWTVVTRDGSLSAHYENTVLITKDEPVLLTLLK